MSFPLCVVVASLCLVSVALASPACPPQDGDWVQFDVASSFDVGFATAARAHLAAELEPRGVAVCSLASGSARPALAKVSVSGVADGMATLRIEDEVAQTVVQRNIDFTHVPAQGRALTFGLATDELLGVGWARVIAPHQAASTANVAAMVMATPVKLDAVTLAAVTLAASSFTSGPHFVGPQLVLAYHHGRLVPDLRLGVRWGSELSATHGQVAFSDVHVALGATYFVTPPQWRLSVGPYVGVEAARITVRGEAAAGALARQGDGVGLVAQAAMMGYVRIAASLRLIANIGAGYALVPVRAADAGQNVGGVAALAAIASVGLGAMF